MKKSIWIALAATVLCCAAGCGKKEEAPSPVSGPASIPVEEASEGSSEGPSEEAVDEISDVVSDDTVEPAAPTAEEEAKTIKTGSDDTGVYPGSTGTAEVPMGIREAVCSVKLPLNYIINGGYYDEEEIARGLEGLGLATTTVADGVAAGSFSGGHVMAYYVMTSLDAEPTVITATMYNADTQGTLEDMKIYYPDGKVIGDGTVPGWLYHKEDTGKETDFAVAMQVSGDVLLEFTYEGPLDNEVGEDEAAQRLYGLVTVK